MTASFRRRLAALSAVLFGLASAPAFATASLSPTQLDPGAGVTFTISASTGSLEVVTEVSAQFPGVFAYVGCDGPADWSCSAQPGDPTVITWSRNGLGTADPTLTLTMTAPEEPGNHAVVLTDRTQTGGASTNTVTVTVVAPEPSEDPSEEPSEDPTEAPSEVAGGRSAPPTEPFRPPDADGGTIALGEDRGEAPVSSVVSTDEPTPIARDRSLVQTAAIPVAGLLLLSAMSFLGAYLLREEDESGPEGPGTPPGRWVPRDRRPTT